MIIKLEEKHLEAAISIISEAARDLSSSGIDQWDDEYPNRNDITEDIAAGDAFGMFVGGSLAAYICLNQFNEAQYSEVQFSCSNETSLTIHRLAVHPAHQGRGYAGKMIDFAEWTAIESGYSCIRFDAFSKNQRALSIYEKRGYQKRGKVRFRKGLFLLYEKRIK